MLNKDYFQGSKSFLLFKSDIYKIVEYTNGKGETKQSALVRMPIANEFVTLSWPAYLLTAMKVDTSEDANVERPITYVKIDDQSDGFNYVKIKFAVDKNREYELRTKEGDGDKAKFVVYEKMNQEDLFAILEAHQQSVFAAAKTKAEKLRLQGEVDVK